MKRTDTEPIHPSDNEQTDLEFLSADFFTYVHQTIWPGLWISSMIFSAFVFDMAYDREDVDLTEPITVTICTLWVVPLMQLLFYKRKAYLERKLKQNRMTIDTTDEFKTLHNPLLGETQEFRENSF